MKNKNFESLLYSSIGVVAMFLVLLALYVVVSGFKFRVDMTQDKAFTLSQGTRNILAKLDTPVTLRFYCSQAQMPPPLKPFAQEIDDLLSEYQNAAKGKIIIKRFDPQPDSDAEDSARMDGVQGQPLDQMGGDNIYLGLSISMADEKQVVPSFSPERERLLEYDISRAIARVVNPTPPTIGIMSALPVFGQEANPMMAQMGQQPQDPYFYVSELKNDFTVKEVPVTSSKIDDDITVLLVDHPRGITEETEYAIDQFLMRGGKLVAFLDPHAIFDQQHDQMAQMMGEKSGSSSLPSLLRAWGYDFDINRVAADMITAYRNPQTGSLMPTVLALTKDQLNQDDIVTAQIDNLVMLFAGVFTGKPVDGLRQDILAHTSPQSELVESITASLGGEQIIKDFKPSNVAYPLAIRLTGKFKTAFPNGSPKPPGEKEDTNSVATKEPQLKESPASGAVILVGDSDMLANQASVHLMNFFGRQVAQPINGNLDFVQSCVEQMGSDTNLITLRSRGSLNRPFTRLQALEEMAGQQGEAKLKELEDKRSATEQKISELQATKQGSPQQPYILSPQQKTELDNYQKAEAETAKELRQVQKNLRKDTDSLEAWIRILNIGAMPALVALTGIVLSVVKRKRTAAK